MKTKHVLGLLMALSAACTKQNDTMIVVEVGTELSVPFEMDSVRIDVIGPTANSSDTYPYRPTWENPWPVRLALVPDSDKSASLIIRATGLASGIEVVSQAVHVAFVPGRAQLLRLWLPRPCAYMDCGPTQSCAAGACVPTPTVTDLPEYDPNSSGPVTGSSAPALPVGGSVGGIGGAGGMPPVGGRGGDGGAPPIGGTGGITGGTGGTSRAGASGSTAGACSARDVVGIWDVQSSTLRTFGQADISYLGLECSTAQIIGDASVSGRLTLGADGKYIDKTVTKGSDVWEFSDKCLSLSGTRVSCKEFGTVLFGLLSNFGYESFSCEGASVGGCACQGKINQTGGLGLLYNDLTPTAKFSVTGDTLSLGDNMNYGQCAQGNEMTVSPRPGSQNGTPYTGTIALQRYIENLGGASGSNPYAELPAAPAFTGIPLPCEVISKDEGGGKCVSAHSTVRVIVPGYTGALYQLCKGGSKPGPSSCTGTTQDVGAKDGYADADAHDAFCGSEACTITKIYDQSGKGNDLEPGPKGGAKNTPDNPAKASALPVKINGHRAYGILIKAGVGYRGGCISCNIKKGNGMPLGDEPQTVYMVTSQKDLVDGCCFDYGNAETTCNDDGNGTIEAVYFGGGVVWGTGSGGKPGPWVMADLENGLYAGWENKQDKNISTNKPLKFDFVTAVVVGDTADKNSGKGRFALYGADAQGKDAALGKMTCMYDGIRPEKAGYVPAQKQGSVVLGIAGDNSNGAGGRFFEGATFAGPAVSRTTLSYLQAVIAAAKYEIAK